MTLVVPNSGGTGCHLSDISLSPTRGSPCVPVLQGRQGIFHMLILPIALAARPSANSTSQRHSQLKPSRWAGANSTFSGNQSSADSCAQLRPKSFLTCPITFVGGSILIPICRLCATGRIPRYRDNKSARSSTCNDHDHPSSHVHRPRSRSYRTHTAVAMSGEL